MYPEHHSLDYRHAAYTVSASKLAQCPADSLREVAFLGRSNAGKSSAINTLTGQKSLARTSKTPGRTQLLNFFQIEPQIYLVDLPGFGYAKVPEAMKLKWQKELEGYLQKREALQGLVILMDIRHPLKDTEQQIIHWAGLAEMPLHILLTKADKLKRGAAKTTLLATRKQLSDYQGEISIQLFSALKGDGVRELSKKMDQWLCVENDVSSDAAANPEADTEAEATDSDNDAG